MSDDLTRTIDLVRRAQAGESDAFERVCARYYERVRRIVRQRLGPSLRKLVDSGDVLQETFLQAVRNFEGFEMREEAALIQWLAKISERQVIAVADRHASQKRDREREVELDAPSGIALEPADDASAPPEALARAEQSALVEACLDEISHEHRELILLRDYAGASWELIAAETGRPSASAARRMHARALVELGRSLRAKGVSGTDEALQGGGA